MAKRGRPAKLIGPKRIAVNLDSRSLAAIQEARKPGESFSETLRRLIQIGSVCNGKP